MKININNIFSFLFNIYLIILVFDPMRESLIAGPMQTVLSIGRDFFIICLVCCLLISKKRKRLSLILLSFGFSIFALVILSFFADVDKLQSLKSAYVLLRGLLLCYVIINFNIVYNFSVEWLMRYYITLILVNFILSAIIFYMFPELLLNKYTYNRLSVGNPSLQSIIFISAFTLCFYYRPFHGLKNYLFSLILLIAIVSTVTSTAFFSLAAILILTIFKKEYCYYWVLILLGLTGLLVIVMKETQFDIEMLVANLSVKTDQLIQVIFSFANNEDTTVSNSLNIRNNQIDRFFESATGTSLLFGDGIYSMINQENTMIENTYVAILKDFGIYGLIWYLCFLGIILKHAVKKYFSNKSTILLIVLCVIASYSYTLYVIGTTSTMIQLLFFFWIVYSKEYILKTSNN